MELLRELLKDAHCAMVISREIHGRVAGRILSGFLRGVADGIPERVPGEILGEPRRMIIFRWNEMNQPRTEHLNNKDK